MRKPSNPPLTIAITTGDADGIGSEVAARALAKIGPLKGCRILFFRSSKCPKSHLSLLKKKFKVKTVKSLGAIASFDWQGSTLLDIASDAPPVEWVIHAANACLANTYDALVTGPLSKTSIHQAGYSEIGHTEIFATLSGISDLTMGFLGQKFSVVLLTGHAPLQAVPALMTRATLEAGVTRALELRQFLPPSKKKRPLALVGLNPHAGEAGLIGKEESRLFSPTLEKMRQSGIPIEGPLVPDAAFQTMNQKRYSVYLCPYHDQGLIPFKLAHGFNHGVHITLGLPFVRTSVDHGTAKELFNRGTAQYGSMVDAIKTAIQMAEHRKAGVK